MCPGKDQQKINELIAIYEHAEREKKCEGCMHIMPVDDETCDVCNSFNPIVPHTSVREPQPFLVFRQTTAILNLLEFNNLRLLRIKEARLLIVRAATWGMEHYGYPANPDDEKDRVCLAT